MTVEIEKIDNEFFVKCVDVYICVKCGFFANKKFDKCLNCNSNKIAKDAIKFKASKYTELPF